MISVEVEELESSLYERKARCHGFTFCEKNAYLKFTAEGVKNFRLECIDIGLTEMIASTSNQAIEFPMNPF